MDTPRHAEAILAGQRALVTRANSGIGAATARALAADGAKVVVIYVTHPNAAAAIVDDINSAGREAMAIQADMSREDQARKMFGKMFEAYGSIDILVNIAGLLSDSWLHEITLGTGATLYVDGGVTLYPGFREGG